MKVLVTKEKREGEKRVALVPDVVSKLTRAGLEVAVESGAGLASGASDAAYVGAGATITSDVKSALSGADVILSVQPLTPTEIATLKSGAITISFLSPSTFGENIAAAEKASVTALALELVPRISRAQSMDALTSQALCAGYRAALVAVSYTHLRAHET